MAFALLSKGGKFEALTNKCLGFHVSFRPSPCCKLKSLLQAKGPIQHRRHCPTGISKLHTCTAEGSTGAWLLAPGRAAGSSSDLRLGEDSSFAWASALQVTHGLRCPTSPHRVSGVPSSLGKSHSVSLLGKATGTNYSVVKTAKAFHSMALVQVAQLRQLGLASDRYQPEVFLRTFLEVK